MVNIYCDDWSIGNVKAVLFDKDGTFIDSHVYWGEIIKRRANAIIHDAVSNNIDFNDLCRSMGLDTNEGKLVPEGPIALLPRDKVIEAVCFYLEESGSHIDFRRIENLFYSVHKEFLSTIDNYLKVINGSIQFFNMLKDNDVKMAVVTTDTVINAEEAVCKLSLSHFFNCVIGKESTKEPKTSGIPALKAMEQLEVDPSDTICVGDAPMDLIMSKNSNCKAAIGVTTGQLPRDVLLEHSDFVVSSLTELSVERAG